MTYGVVVVVVSLVVVVAETSGVDVTAGAGATGTVFPVSGSYDAEVLSEK